MTDALPLDTLARAEVKGCSVFQSGIRPPQANALWSTPMTDIDLPAHGLTKPDNVAAVLTELSVMLAEATTLPELQKLEKKASAFRHLLRVAKFNLVWQNRFFKVRAQCLRRIGAIIDTMEKHQGGRPAKKPLPGEEGFHSQPETIPELGFSYNFTSECQRIARMPHKVFDAYLALGEAVNDQVEELTKRGLLDWGAAAAAAETENYSESKNVKAADRQEPKAATATETRHRGSGNTKTWHQQVVFAPHRLAELIGKVNRGDCLELMRLVPHKSIKAIITSPPYNIRLSTGGGLRNVNRGKWPNAQLLTGYDQHDDMMDRQEYIAWQRECLAEMIRVLRDDGAIFYNHKRRVQDGKLQDPSEIVNGLALPVRQIIIWKRSGGINFNPGYFLPTYELIYLIAGPHFKIENDCLKYSDVWEMSQERHNPHPAPFPLELPLRCIELIGEGIILDPFLGSGTTAVAAIQLGRPWIGIERSEKYCNAARERIGLAVSPTRPPAQEWYMRREDQGRRDEADTRYNLPIIDGATGWDTWHSKLAYLGGLSFEDQLRQGPALLSKFDDWLDQIYGVTPAWKRKVAPS